MSGIAGAFQLDNGPVDPALIRAMTEAIVHRGPDAGGCWIQACIGMGQRSRWSTTESRHERHPFVDEAHQLCLVLDGRVDNRDELSSDLRSAGYAPRDETDAELVLRAYQAWAEDAPRRIHGDFAFAVWDGNSRSIFCARDIIGLRPLHYALTTTRFLFGSELQQIFRDAEFSMRLNEGMVAELLAWSVNSPDETLYTAIRRLPPAHWMRVGQGGTLRIERYWSVDFAKRIRHSRVADYAAQLRELLSASVQCRLRGPGPIGADLSGGMDSSTVSVLAHKALSPVGGLHAYSTSYADMPCDESAYVKAIAEHVCLPVTLLPYREAREADFRMEAARFLEAPGMPLLAPHVAALASIDPDCRARVMLSGLGGDEWFTGEPDCLADAPLHGRFATLAAQLRDIADWQEISTVRALERHLFRPWARRAGERLGWLRSYRKRRASMTWLSADWMQKVDLLDRIIPPSIPGRGASCGQLSKHLWTTSPHLVHEHETTERIYGAAGIEYRYPLMDRRLIEFSFAIPQELHWGGGMPKRLLREAMRDLLPHDILARRTKSEFSFPFMRALDSVLAASPMREWYAARAGWIRADALGSLYQRARDNVLRGEGGGGAVMWRTWMTYAVGLAIEAQQLQQRATRSIRYSATITSAPMTGAPWRMEA
jgi:asparagine synthase (glutamine-hydrolysing)